MNNNINVGSISGGKNNIRQNNYHIKHIQPRHGGNDGRSGKHDDAGDGLVAVFGIFFVMVAVAFFYLRHYDPIFTCLKLSMLAVCATHFMSGVPIWQNPSISHSDIGHPLFGIVLAGIQMWIVMMTFDAMPKDIINLANQYAVVKFSFPKAMEFWNQLSPYGHHLTISNMVTALCLVPAILLNLLYAMQHLLELLADTDEHGFFAHVADRLQQFKATGLCVSVMFTVLAYLIISGTIFSYT